MQGKAEDSTGARTTGWGLGGPVYRPETYGLAPERLQALRAMTPEETGSGRV